MAGTPLVWLLTVSLPDGTVIRAATRPTTLTSASGQVYAFDAILTSDPVYGEEVDLFSLDSSASFQQAQVSVLTSEDLAVKAADWRAVASGKGELAIMMGDTTGYEQRRILLADGRIQNLQMGKVGELTVLVLEGLGSVAGANVGGDTIDMGDVWADPLTDTVAGAISSLVGRKRVFVYGDAKRVPAYKVGAVSGSDRLVLCGHLLPDLGSISVYEDDGGPVVANPFTDSNTGGSYSYVSSGTVYRAANGGYTWDATRGGTRAYNDFSKPALRASGVLARLLQDSGEKVDWDAMQPTLKRLDRFQCGFWVDEEVGALDLIRQRLAPVFPIVEVMGSEGLYFAYSDPHVREPECTLTEGQELHRVGPMTFSDADATYTSFSLLYDYNMQSGAYDGSATIDHTNDALCLLAYQLGGNKVRAEKPLKTTAVHDSGTAYGLLRARASRLALQRRQLTFYAVPDVLPLLRAGMVFLLNTDTWGISDHKAVIRSIQYGEAAATVAVDLIDRTPNSRR